MGLRNKLPMPAILNRHKDWSECPIEDIVDCFDNLRVPLNDGQRQKMQGDYPYCGANGVLDYISSYCVDDSVILIAEDGGYFDEYATRPIAYRMAGKFWVNNHAHVLRAKADVDQDFVFHALVHKNILSFLASGTRAKLNKRELNKIVISLPRRKEEQTRIASVLNDAGAYIELLERLLEKKRAIMQGAMQELLTGKRRLPGFGEEWVVRQLCDLADIRSGGTPSTRQASFWAGDILWCTPTDITALDGFKYLDATARTISRLGLKASSAEMIPPNSIVMTSRATIGECAINRVAVSTNQGFKNLIPANTADVEFLYYLMLTQKQGLIRLCGGSTFLEISKSQLSEYELRVPASRSEQTAIAMILSDMDADIFEHQSKLAKARDIKQGMMQQLLTGKIRLV